MYILIWLFFIHFIGDFVCQSRYIAENKGMKFSILLLHVLIYISVIWLGLSFILPTIPLGKFLLLNYLLHVLTDFITSKFTTYFWLKENKYGFFTTVGFDQFLHISTLTLSLEIIQNVSSV